MGWATGKHALITGGGTGIGAAAARMLAAEGAKVSLVGRRKEPLDAVAGLRSAPDGEARFTALDRLRDPPEGSTPLAVVTGVIDGVEPVGTLLLAVDGEVVSASELSTDSSGRAGRFTFLVPQGALGGEREIRVAVVREDGALELAVTG